MASKPPTSDTVSEVVNAVNSETESKKGKTPAFSIDKVAASTSKVYYFKPSEVIEEKGFNVRDWTLPENKEHLERITVDIKEIGSILVPGTVRVSDNKIIVVSGHTRLKAAQKLEKAGVKTLFPATLETKGTSEIER